MFLPDESSVLMADKFGDLLRFSCDRPNEEYEVVLGHLSMLMDLAIVDRGSAICTADRDEKIRISCYPNSYNIKVSKHFHSHIPRKLRKHCGMRSYQ